MWTTRRATRADTARLVELCRAAVGPDDYVPDFLDDFLSTGVVFLAEDADRVLGMAVYHDCPDGSAWLHAARTHPEHRREGIATALMSRCESLARQRHRNAMRLWASVHNVASVNANRKYGYRERGRFTRMRLEVGRGAEAGRLEPVDLARDWPLLRDSALLRQSRGFVFHDFYFMPLTRDVAAWLARRESLMRFGGNVVCLSPGVEDPSGHGMQIHLVAGDAGEILRAARWIAAGRRAEDVQVFLPHDPFLLGTARRAGFRLMAWGREAVLFEMRPRARGAAAGTGHRRAGARGSRPAPSGRRRRRAATA